MMNALEWWYTTRGGDAANSALGAAVWLVVLIFASQPTWFVILALFCLAYSEAALLEHCRKLVRMQ